MKKPTTYTTGSKRVTIKSFDQTLADNTVRGVEVTGIPNRPRTYSIKLFTKLPDGTVHPSIRPNTKVENALATTETPGLAFSRLIDDAALFIQAAVQEDEDNFIERKQERELRGEYQEKPKQGLGKFSPKATADEIAEARRKREANLSARRAADQAQRTKMRGK